MEKVLEIKNLKKSYKKNHALKGISFDVYKGEILGILGPNGAGKSTMINILSTILQKDEGEILYFGKQMEKNEREIKKKIGVVPQDLAIYEDIPSYNNIKLFASLYGLKGQALEEAVSKALDFVKLEDRKKDKPKTYSGGMKRRLNIACSIAHSPEILILDEPTVGIDPQSRNHILKSLLELKKQGTTIMYTTHYMEEIEEIADRVIIMDNGTKIEEGTVYELLNKYKKESLEEVFLSLTGKNLRD